MTNGDKANEIARSLELRRCDYYSAAMGAFEAIQWKDEQPIAELRGWHTKEPTIDCYVLLKTKNREYIVAEWDNDAKCFYSETGDFPISWKKWKMIEKIKFKIEL